VRSRWGGDSALLMLSGLVSTRLVQIAEDPGVRLTAGRREPGILLVDEEEESMRLPLPRSAAGE